MPTNTPANACGGKVFTIEMHHTRHEQAKPGNNVGLNIKGLDKQNMPRVGDVMIYKKDKSLDQCGEFTAQIQTLDIPGEIKLGYSPIGFVRCGRSACRATAFNFKVGKETGGKKMESPHSLKSNEMAEIVFRPQRAVLLEVPRGARAAAGDALARSRVVRPFSLFMASLWHDAKGRTSVNAVCVHRLLVVA